MKQKQHMGLLAAGTCSLALVASSVFSATVGSNLDSSLHTEFDGKTVIDAVAVPDDSPISDGLVQNNGNVRVATIFLVQETPVGDAVDADRRLIFQATNGATKSRDNIDAPAKAATECTSVLANGNRLRFGEDDVSMFSEDGALLASEAQVREKGASDWLDVVIVWSVVPDGNSGGKAAGGQILCMDSLAGIDIVRKDDGKGNALGDQYLVWGSDDDLAASYVVGL